MKLHTATVTRIQARLPICAIICLGLLAAAFGLLPGTPPPDAAYAATAAGPLKIVPTDANFGQRFRTGNLGIPETFWYPLEKTDSSANGLLAGTKERSGAAEIVSNLGIGITAGDYYFIDPTTSTKGTSGVTLSNLKIYDPATRVYKTGVTMTITLTDWSSVTSFSDDFDKAHGKEHRTAIAILKNSADPYIRLLNMTSATMTVSYSQAIHTNMEFWDIDAKQSVTIWGAPDYYYVGAGSKLSTTNDTNYVQFAELNDAKGAASGDLAFMGGVAFSNSSHQLRFTRPNRGGNAMFRWRKSGKIVNNPGVTIRVHANGSATNPATFSDGASYRDFKDATNGNVGYPDYTSFGNTLPSEMVDVNNRPSRAGCLFDGWTDSSGGWYTNDAAGGTPVLHNMGANTLKSLAGGGALVNVYSRWRAHLYFHPSGGTVYEAPRDSAASVGDYQSGYADGYSRVTRIYYLQRDAVGAYNYPNAGYSGRTFDGWYTASAAGSKSTSLALERDTWLYARWAVALTFNPQGGTVGEAAVADPADHPVGAYNSATAGGNAYIARTYYLGTGAVAAGGFPTPVRAGYTFDGWYTDAVGGTRVGSSISLNVHTTLHARWRNTLTFVPQGGTVNDSTAYNSYDAGRYVTAKSGNDVVRTYFINAAGTIASGFPSGGNITRTNLSFDGWYTEPAVGSAITSRDMSTSGTVYARWRADLVFDPQGGAVSETAVADPANHPAGSYRSVTAGGNANVTRSYYMDSAAVTAGGFPLPSRTGFTFVGWYTDAVGGAKVGSSITLSTHTTLYARWKNDLTFDPLGGAVSDTTDNTSHDAGKYTINANDGKPIRTYYMGTAVVNATDFRTPARAGYASGYDGWYTSETAGSAVTQRSMATSGTLYARWKVTLTFDPYGGAVSDTTTNTSHDVGKYTIVPNSGKPIRTYYFGANAPTASAFAVPTRPGFKFMGWYTAKRDGTKIESFALMGNTTLYARWRMLQPDISILPDSPTYPEGNENGGNPYGTYTYYSDTDVITAIDIRTTENIHPDPMVNKTDEDGNAIGTLKVKFTLGSSDFLWRGIVIPKGGTQRVWLKWHTPATATEEDVDILVEASALMDQYDEEEYLKGYKTATLTAHILPLKENTPPDPKGKDTNPYETFTPEAAAPTVTAADRTTSAWSKHRVAIDYNVDNGDLSVAWNKENFSASLSADPMIVPSRRAPTAEIIEEAAGKYTMKSAYGVEAQISNSAIIAASANAEIATDYSVLQHARAHFPEFLYGTYDRLLWRRPVATPTRDADGELICDELLTNEPLIFSRNKYSQYDDPVHFTPIWYPDDKAYTVKLYAFDAWTPVGELRRLSDTADDITIKGDVYDDWHIAPTAGKD